MRFGTSIYTRITLATRAACLSGLRLRLASAHAAADPSSRFSIAARRSSRIRCVRSSNQSKIADIVVSKPNSVHPSAIVTHHTLLRFVMLCAGLGAQ